MFNIEFNLLPHSYIVVSIGLFNICFVSFSYNGVKQLSLGKRGGGNVQYQGAQSGSIFA